MPIGSSDSCGYMQSLAPVGRCELLTGPSWRAMRLLESDALPIDSERVGARACRRCVMLMPLRRKKPSHIESWDSLNSMSVA